MDDIEKMLAECDYKNVLKYFTELSGIPRGSGYNDKISDFLVSFAKEQGLKYVQDEAKNVIIYKSASAGYENHTGVVLQGHMDMVCVSEDGYSHDFEKEGLELFVEGDFLGARGTTLGGDDGIAMAYGMAMLADDTLAHPSLELVVTTDEETGMDGAKALDASLIQGRSLINVDSEEEGVVLVGCAGGLRVNANLELMREECEGTLLSLELTGLNGGHSGAEIHKFRVNAVYQMARLLFELRESCDYALADFYGGEKDNAIPCAASCSILVENKTAESVKASIEALFKKYSAELSTREPNMKLSVCVKENAKAKVLLPVSFEKLLFILMQAPDGVQRMSADIEGLVESSLNLGIFNVTEDKAEFHFSVRSSVGSYKYFVRDRITYLFDFLGGECESGSEYPAWEYRKESPLRDKFIEIFEGEYKRKPEVQAIHAGLECGLICEKLPDMDIISIGPDMKDIHTPKERLGISSSIRVYQFLEKLVSAL